MKSLATLFALGLCLALVPACNDDKHKGGSDDDSEPDEPTTHVETVTVGPLSAERFECDFSWSVDVPVPEDALSVQVAAKVIIKHPRNWTGISRAETTLSEDGVGLDVTWSNDEALIPTYVYIDHAGEVRTDVDTFPAGVWTLAISPGPEDECERISESTLELTATYEVED